MYVNENIMLLEIQHILSVCERAVSSSSVLTHADIKTHAHRWAHAQRLV